MVGELSDRNQQTECDEPLLLWAVRDSNQRKFVHIGMLTPAEKGAACRCLCRNCGERLIAINVDKPKSHFEKPRTQRRHFKHNHSDLGQSKCLSAVARLLALQLFVEQDAIYLPPRYRTVSKVSPTGITIQAKQETPGGIVQVKSRTWIDEVSAILLLEDGRELLVTIRTHQSVNEDRYSTCVLTLAKVSDPAIASWDSEKILQHLRLPLSGMDWEKHWGDIELDAQKNEDLAGQEAIYFGGIPKEWLENLNGKQASETILHWLIKKAVAEQSILRVPAFSIPVRQEMPDETIAEEFASCGEDILELTEVRLERRLDGMVPDVMCQARSMVPNRPIVDLLIEAAVTNYISEDKRQKIITSGAACIQIRADLFSKTGTVPVTEIARIVSSDASVKEWIVHPWIADEVAKAKRRLAVKAGRINFQISAEAAAEKKRADDRTRLENWRKNATDLSLAKGYLKALKPVLTGKPALQSGDEPVSLDDLWYELDRRQIVQGNRHRVETTGSLLSQLANFKEAPSELHADTLLNQLTQAVEHHWTSPSHALVTMFFLEANEMLMTQRQKERFRVCSANLRALVQKGGERSRRFTEHDRLYALLFPEMASRLKSDYGTAVYMSKLRQELAAQENDKQRRQKSRSDRVALAVTLRSKKIQNELNQAIETELAAVAGKLRWIKSIGDDKGPALLYGLYGGQVRLQNIGAMDVFKIAIDHRNQNISVDTALRAMSFRHAPDVAASIKLLQIAKVCSTSK